MPGRRSKSKGAAGEREVADIIFYNTGVRVERNLEQTRGGGYDLTGIPGLAIEVKRQEKLAIPSWWRQTVAQARVGRDIPVLAYRQNRKPWTFIVGLDKAEMDRSAFVEWINVFLKQLV